MTILTAVYGRPDIFEIFLHHLPLYPLIVAGSSTDDCYKILQQTRPDAVWVEYDNNPLSDKFNAASEALRSMDFDYVFITGSDDIYTPGLFDYYESLKNEYDYAGLLDFYFTDFQQTKYCPGFQHNRKGEPHGAGRMISKGIVEQLDFQLWDYDLNSGLDASMTRRLHAIKKKEHFFSCKELGEIAMDLKTNNIQSMEDYEGEYISNDIIKKVLKHAVWW